MEGERTPASAVAGIVEPASVAAMTAMARSLVVLCLDLPTAERLRTARMPVAAAQAAADRAQALADPTRLTLAAALRDGIELCVCDLSWILERSQSLTSHHARVLRRAGLVEARRDGKLVLYRLTPVGDAALRTLVTEPSLA